MHELCTVEASLDMDACPRLYSPCPCHGGRGKRNKKQKREREGERGRGEDQERRRGGGEGVRNRPDGLAETSANERIQVAKRLETDETDVIQEICMNRRIFVLPSGHVASPAPLGGPAVPRSPSVRGSGPPPCQRYRR
jgi:hypothetical protein